MKTPPTSLPAEAQPWIDWLRANGRSERTLGNCQIAIKLAAQFWRERGGPTSLHGIKEQDIDEWSRHLDERQLASSTRDGYVRPWINFFRWLELHGKIFINPVRNFILPKVHRRMMPVVSEQDMARFLDSLSGHDPRTVRDRAILELAYATGARRGELQGLDVDDLDLEEAVVAVRGKGGKERLLPVTATAVAAIRDYLTLSRPIFAQHNPASKALWLGGVADLDGRLSPYSLHHICRQRSSAVGLRLAAHDMRRAFATHLLRRGLGPNELRLLLGHAGFRHIKHYVRYAAVDLHRTHRQSRLSR